MTSASMFLSLHTSVASAGRAGFAARYGDPELQHMVIKCNKSMQSRVFVYDQTAKQATEPTERAQELTKMSICGRLVVSRRFRYLISFTLSQASSLIV